MFKSQSASDIGRQRQLVTPVWAAHGSVLVVDQLSLYLCFVYRCQSSFIASGFLINDNVSFSMGLHISNGIAVEK